MNFASIIGQKENVMDKFSVALVSFLMAFGMVAISFVLSAILFGNFVFSTCFAVFVLIVLALISFACYRKIETFLQNYEKK